MYNENLIMNRYVDERTASNYTWNITRSVNNSIVDCGMATSPMHMVEYFVTDSFFQDYFDILISFGKSNVIVTLLSKCDGKFGNKGEVVGVYTASPKASLPPISNTVVKTTRRILTDVSITNNAGTLSGDNPPW